MSEATTSRSVAAEAAPTALGRLWESGIGLILLVTAARVAYLLWMCPYTLIEDEAHYWEWSRKLELSYYSKGPGVAWVIRAATELFGTHEWSVRLPAVLAGAVGAALAAGLAREVSTRPRAGLYAAAIYFGMPAFWVLGILMTIDGPYLACWAGACWAGWRALRTGSAGAWACLGLALGVGFLFKYTILLLVPGLAIAAWRARRDGSARRGGAARGLILASALAAAGLIPVALWNAEHGWITVRHLLGHLGAPGGDMPTETGAGWSPLWTLELLAAQVGLAGPAILLAAFVGERAWRERGEKPEIWRASRYLILCGAPVLIFYLLISLIAEPEGNWPLAAWVTAAPLGALGVTEAFPERRRRREAWIAAGRPGRRPRMGRIVAWRFTLVAGVILAAGFARADLLARIPWIGGIVPRGRLMYADTRAADAARIMERLGEETGLEPFLMAQHYGRASQMAFYLPGRPRVYSASAHTGGRTTQYDVWPETDLSRPVTIAALAGRPALLVGGEPHHWRGAFDRVEDAGQLEGEHKEGRRIYLGYGFLGFDARPATGEEMP